MEELILEFRQWNDDWEKYAGEGIKPLSIIAFCNKLKKKYKVIKK